MYVIILPLLLCLLNALWTALTLIINGFYYKKYNKFYFLLNLNENSTYNKTVTRKSRYDKLYESVNLYFMYRNSCIKIAFTVIMIKIAIMYYTYYIQKARLAANLQMVIEKILALYNTETILPYNDVSVDFLFKLL